MMINKVQAASIVMLMALFTVPSLAIPGNSQPRCYQADLILDDTVYGHAKLWVSGNANFLEIEIEDFPYSGTYEIKLFKDYYSDFVAGDLEIEDGDGEDKYKIPYQDPDFKVLIYSEDYELVSGDWIECEIPEKNLKVKISPQTLNLKSKGKWVTVKVTVPTDPEPTDFELWVGEDGPIPSSWTKVAPGHVMIKFSRVELQELCEEGSVEVTLTFKIGEETIELSDVIRVIHGGNQEPTQTHQANNKVKSNNGKANRKSNGKAKGKNKGN
jgi:hypothetical protein